MSMDNTVRTPNDLFANIDVPLKKAKAITFLMAYAAKEGSFQCGEELAWAQQIVDELIDNALTAAEQLAEIGRAAAC